MSKSSKLNGDSEEETSYYKYTGKYKLFDQKLFEKYDIPARNVLKNCLGDKVDDNPNIYTQDMIINIMDTKYKYVELQVCTNWSGNRFPHSNPYIYERKGTYGDDTLFIIFNKYFNSGYMFDGAAIKGTKCQRLKKYSRFFVHFVPWYKIRQFGLHDLEEVFNNFINKNKITTTISQ